MKKNKIYIICSFLFLIGLSILLYPTISNWWNERRAAKLMSAYTEKVSALKGNESSKLLKEAKEYNQTLLGNKVPDAFSVKKGNEDSLYEGLLDPMQSGLIGEVEIPAIDVKIPIYHYTYPEILEKGAGHLYGSSLPVGGVNTHTVITAHRGLPSAKLFTDLNLLKEGDCFYIHVLGETLAYKITSTETVEPTEVKSLEIKKGEDLATLVTCTPYAVNSHRLLVHAERTTLKDAEQKATTPLIVRKMVNAPMLIVCILTGILLALLCFFIVKRFLQKEKM